MNILSNRWRLNAAWISAVVLLIIMTIKFEPTAKEFLGVVASDEVISSSKAGGRVTNIYVKSGQAIKQGDLLAELEDISLELEINKSEYELNSLLAQVEIGKTLSGAKAGKGSKTDPTMMQINQLKKDLKLRKQQKESQKIYAVSDGIVGAVFAKAGQHVAPYQSVVSIYSANVELVNGFIHEEGNSTLKVGDMVEVISSTDAKKRTLASVENLGLRITEFPERLKANPSVKAWGREVLIRLPSGHPFLAAEKVIIRKASKEALMKPKKSSFSLF